MKIIKTASYAWHNIIHWMYFQEKENKKKNELWKQNNKRINPSRLNDKKKLTIL